MTSNLADHIAEIWQRLVNDYRWQYTPNASTIIQQTVAWCENETTHDLKVIRQRLITHYTEMLYHGLQHQLEDAAQDLQRACIQAGRQSKYSAAELEDFAADAVMTVIRKLDEINPQRLLAYAFACMRNASKAKANQPNTFSLNEQYDGSNGYIDSSISKVEQDLTETALKQLLKQTLDNHIELEIIYRSYFLDEKPHTIAVALGMRPEQVRVIKSRTLKKLRNNPQAMQIFRQLLVES